MTREEFILEKSESERQIRRLVIPVGIIYSLRIGAILGLIYCAVLLWEFFGTPVPTRILLVIGFLVLLFGISFPAARYSYRRFAQLSLKCPFCQSCLVFDRADVTTKTGCCYHCGKKVFE
jgi:hypothetical protein